MGKTLNSKRVFGIFLFVVSAVFASHDVMNLSWAVSLTAGTALVILG